MWKEEGNNGTEQGRPLQDLLLVSFSAKIPPELSGSFCLHPLAREGHIKPPASLAGSFGLESFGGSEEHSLTHSWTSAWLFLKHSPVLRLRHQTTVQVLSVAPPRSRRCSTRLPSATPASYSSSFLSGVQQCFTKEAFSSNNDNVKTPQDCSLQPSRSKDLFNGGTLLTPLLPWLPLAFQGLGTLCDFSVLTHLRIPPGFLHYGSSPSLYLGTQFSNTTESSLTCPGRRRPA